MAIQNRDHGLSEQRVVINSKPGAVATGVTTLIGGVIPFPCELEKAVVAASGISGSPAWAIQVHRFANGLTSFSIGASVLLIQAFGTSGAQGYSSYPSGHSLVQLQKGDCIMVLSSGSNAAVADSSVSLVVRKLEDIVKHFDLTT